METFSTYDMNLAAFLQYHNIPLELGVLQGRVFFVFKQSDGLNRLIGSYHAADAEINLSRFLEHLKVVKTRMFSLRGQMR